MNKSTILRAVLVAVLSLVATTATAHDFEKDGIYYNYNGDGDGTVSVTYDDSFTDEYTGDVVIPSSVTYSGTTYSVTSIGELAFWDCSGLKSVSIPNSVTSIGEAAFSSCSGLTSVSIPNSVTSIGYSAFYGCSGLKSVSIPNSVTSIGESTFANCSGLKSVSIPNSVTSIGDHAFANCSGLTSVSIGNSVETIGGGAFEYCSGLTSVTIPNSVTSIGDSAFYECSGLKSVTIGDSVTSIGNYAFWECGGLTRVDISSIEAWLGISFSSNPLYYAHHLYLNGEEVKNLIIPNSVEMIGDNAFERCSGLTSVTIPNSVTSIGDSAFRDCSGLTNVTIGNSVETIGDHAFYCCSGLKSVSIGNSVTSIGHFAFEFCSGLKTIYYNAENCSNVDMGVFYNYGNRTYIIIGKDVKKMPNNLFIYPELSPAHIISQSVTPPTCGENTFNSNAYSSAKLYVPSGAVSDYQFADIWSKFFINSLDKPITGIMLSESDLTLKIGETKTITATITPADASIPDAYYWTSSNSSVATVDDNGMITAIEDGSAIISACSCDGGDVVATCNVTVKTTKATSISLNVTELKIAKNETATLYYTILPEDVSVKTAEWIVSDGSILSYKINDDGSILIGGKSEGSATVTARTTDGSNLEAICVVTVGASGVEGVDVAATRIFAADGNIIIAAAEDGEAAIYDFTGRLIKNVAVEAGDNTAVPMLPGCYIIKVGAKTQSVVVK